ncbi:MAG: DNA polymerase III subunit delta [Gemmatimonadales bacterium]|nr:DNA polymerase III subunit delta [Gemmatimonadales bacterium]
MAAHSWDDPYKTLRKGTLPAAIYLYGAEDPLKDDALDEILDRALDPGLRDFNLDTRSASSLDPEDVVTLLTTLPMMADRRVVIIRDVESWNKRAKAKSVVLDCLDRPSPETLVVLIQGAGDPEKAKANDPDADLAKRAYAVDCGRLPADRAARWLVKEAEKAGLALAPDAVTHLVKALDAELGPLRAELGKLAGLAGGEPLTVDQVSAMLGIRRGETVPDWCEAVMDGHTGRAAAMLPHLLGQSGNSGVRLVITLGQLLVGTALARALRDEGKRGRTLESAVFDALKRSRMWGFDYRTAASQWSRWSEAWTMPRLQAGIQAAIETDMALKATTLSDEAGLVADLVMRLALPMQEAA